MTAAKLSIYTIALAHNNVQSTHDKICAHTVLHAAVWPHTVARTLFTHMRVVSSVPLLNLKSFYCFVKKITAFFESQSCSWHFGGEGGASIAIVWRET